MTQKSILEQKVVLFLENHLLTVPVCAKLETEEQGRSYTSSVTWSQVFYGMEIHFGYHENVHTLDSERERLDRFFSSDLGGPQISKFFAQNI